jgi:hypothetical protein
MFKTRKFRKLQQAFESERSSADGAWEQLGALFDALDLHNGGQRCDMLDGPCACGAWHHLEDIPGRLERNGWRRVR